MIVINRLFQTIAADKSHGIVGAAIDILAQAIDRDDARMFQPAGDLGLQHETGAAFGIVGMLGLDLLQRHFPLEFLVAGHGDFSQAAFGMGAENAEPRARRGRTTDRGAPLARRWGRLGRGRESPGGIPFLANGLQPRRQFGRMGRKSSDVFSLGRTRSPA